MERERGKITYLTLITPVPPTGRVKKKKKKKKGGKGEISIFISVVPPLCSVTCSQ